MGQIILSARSELTFDQGKREYIIKVKLDDGKERLAYHQYSATLPCAANRQEYRFTHPNDASDCAVWLIGREFIGPL